MACYRVVISTLIAFTLFAVGISKDCGHTCFPPSDLILQRVKELQKDNLLPWQNGRTLQAYFGFHVESLSSFRATDMSYDMDMYARISWQDKRFVHNFSMPFLLTRIEEIDLVWKPDLYFANAKEANYQTVTEPNRSLRIDRNGLIHYSARVTLTLSCNQDLRKYPMDTQQCHVRLLSWSHTQDKLNISWFKEPITWNRDIELPEMDVLDIKSGFCNGTYYYGETERYRLIGNFSCLRATIFLRREIGYHVVQTYIPTALIVVISWVSFWIDPSAIPARISLSFTTLLTLSTMAAGVRVSLPPVSYAKAIDMWMGVCMAFVFAGLLEFACVNSLLRNAKRLEGSGSTKNQETQPNEGTKNHHSFLNDNSEPIAKKLLLKAREQTSSNPDLETLSAEDRRRLFQKHSRRARNVDKFFACFMPSSFIVFNFAYWGYYLYEY